MYGLLTLSSLSALHAVIQTLPKYLQVQTNPKQIIVHRVKLFVLFSSLLASLMHFVIFKCNEEQICMAGWLEQRSREYAYTTFGLIQPYSHHLHLAPGVIQFSSVQSLSHVWLFVTPCMNRSTPGLPVHHQLPEFTQTHVHQVGDAIQPSHPLSSPSPPALNPSQPQGLFQWVNSSHEEAKVLKFQRQHQSFQWTPRTDFL